MLLSLLSAQVWGRGRVQINLAEQPYLDKKLHFNVALEIDRFNTLPIRDIRIHYRGYGDHDFLTHRMNDEGLRYLASVDLQKYAGQVVEYFFSVEYADGSYQYYPNEGREGELPYIAVNQSFESGGGIVVISPEPNEIIFTDEFLLTISYFELSSQIDPERTKVFMDNYDVSNSDYLQKFSDFLTYAPRRIIPGQHTLRVELYDFSGRLLTQREWQFSATPRKGPSPVTASEVAIDGNFFAETRNENLNDGTNIRNFHKAGLSLKGGNENFLAGGQIFVSNLEGSDVQPVNRYTLFAQSNFWNERYLRLTGGDAYPQLNPYLLNNVFVRGFYGQLYLRFMNFDFTTGQSVRSIEGNSATGTTGTYKRNILGTRLSFGARRVFQLGITAVKGKDDPNSIRFGDRPEESAAAGLDVFLATSNRKIILEGSINASSYNPDIVDGKDVPYDTLQSLGIDIEKSLYDFATGLITVNQNLVVTPALAYHGTLRLNFVNNNLSVTYKYVDDQFTSLGQPFLRRDVKGIRIADNIRLFQNQLFLNLRYEDFDNNVNEFKDATTNNRTLAFNISYFPLTNLPSLTFGFNNYKRDNGVSAATPTVVPEDNSTNTIQFATNYGFLFSGLRHNFTLNVMNFNRSDATPSGVENLSNTVSFMIQTKYAIPLKSRLEFTLQQTENTVGSTSSNELSFNSFGGGVEYKFGRVFAPEGDLTLSLNGKYGLVNSKVVVTGNPNIDFDYNRSYLSARLIYWLPQIGRISLNGDWISYSGGRNFSDYLFLARYDINF
jgi:hypothetical protein